MQAALERAPDAAAHVGGARARAAGAVAGGAARAVEGAAAAATRARGPFANAALQRGYQRQSELHLLVRGALNGRAGLG